MKPSVVDNLHHADMVVDVEEFHEDGNQRECQQTVEAPSQEVEGGFPMPALREEQPKDTLDQEHIPRPEIHQVQFVLKPFRQHESELQDGAYNHAQGSIISQKGDDL